LLGGAGTLGSDILDADFREYELFVIDDFSESALTEEELKHKCNFRKMSVANEMEMINVFQEFKPDVVIYLATTLSSDQKRAYEANVLGMFNTIACAQKTNFPKIVYIQSFLTRNSHVEIDVNSPVEVKDSYSTWKLAAEFLLNSYTGKKVTLVLASVLSPRLSIGAVPAFVRRIQGKENIRVTNTFRDYIDPGTFISALKALLGCVEDEVKVLGSAKPISTLNILEFTASACGFKLENISYEVVEPKASDPMRVSLNSNWLNELQSNSNSIENCVNTIVKNLIHERKEVRLHH
jgi:nucleoside-diphosphate-sugar epimerase